MTVDEIRLMKEDFLTAEQTAEVMHMDVSRFRYYARTKQLPFPIQESGNRIKVSRIGFLNWHDGKKPEPEDSTTDKVLAEIARGLIVQNMLLTVIAKNMAPCGYQLITEKLKEVYSCDPLQDIKNNAWA